MRIKSQIISYYDYENGFDLMDSLKKPQEGPDVCGPHLRNDGRNSWFFLFHVMFNVINLISVGIHRLLIILDPIRKFTLVYVYFKNTYFS